MLQIACRYAPALVPFLLFMVMFGLLIMLGGRLAAITWRRYPIPAGLTLLAGVLAVANRWPTVSLLLLAAVLAAVTKWGRRLAYTTLLLVTGLVYVARPSLASSVTNPCDLPSRVRVNLDTGTAFAFVAEGSPVLAELEAFVQGKDMVMTQTAYTEFTSIVARIGGPREQARAAALLIRVTRIPDTPSPRAQALSVTQKVGANDKIIFGTGDQLGIVTMTTDAKFIEGARAQGVEFAYFLHPPVPLTGR